MMEEFQSLGFKDMHPMQVEALMEVVGAAMCLAAEVGPEALQETEDAVDAMVKLFGGNGVVTTYEIY